jgi:ArsR family transcriptional regulator, cadmium/lead-responsive transcriptional repressor
MGTAAGTEASRLDLLGSEVLATVRLFRVLSDPTRLAILDLLAMRPRTVSELVAAIGVPQSRISNHLACLRWCRFVEGEREGRTITYRISDPRFHRLLERGRRLAAEHCEHLASCRRIGPDWV